MGLSIGIVGLPNVGKSTIFNALTRAQNAESANYPFCTIEPNKASVPVPDSRVDKLAEMVKPKSVIYATVDFVDIAGLVKGASQGEGLGNKFLTNIRETDAILHVVRCFIDDNVVHVDGSIDPARDSDVIETELIMADFQLMEKRCERLAKQARSEKSFRPMSAAAETMRNHLASGQLAISCPDHDSDAMKALLHETPLLTDKRFIYCANVDEAGLAEDNDLVKALRETASHKNADVVKICAKMEEDMIGMEDEERNEFLHEYGVEESGLDLIIHTGFATLGLSSFLTAGPKEVRAWTIHQGDKAPRAAGVIHTDFERGFIRAKIVSFDDYVKYNGEAGAKTAGVLRLEGKEYVMQDGDIVEFLFNV